MLEAYEKVSMNITLITSFNQTYYDLIGKDSVESVLKYWPTHINFRCYIEQMPVLDHARIQCVDYSELGQEYEKFQQSLQSRSTKKFAKKAWSTIHAMNSVKSGWIVWLDADTITQQTITSSLIDQILIPEKVCTYLGVTYNSRKDGTPGHWLVPETGFYAINTEHRDFVNFRWEYSRRYLEQDFSDLRRSYDNDVFGAALIHSGNRGLDLCSKLQKPYKTPLKHTMLGPYLKHWKAKHSKKTYADLQ